MVKKLEEVFDIPIKQEKECAEKCGCGKPPNKMDPELQSEIDKYLNSIKTEIATSKAPPAAKAPRKHNLTPEGKEKMLSNIQKAREVRRLNVEKSKAQEPQKEIPSPVVKQETPAQLKETIKMEPKAQATPVIQPVIKAEPIQQAPEPKGSLKLIAAAIDGFPRAPYIIKSSFKRAPWVK